MRFELFDEEDGTQRDIYQWFITNCTDDDVEYLEKTFGLLFTYSDLLDKYILCVDHFGTSWDYVEWTTTNEFAGYSFVRTNVVKLSLFYLRNLLNEYTYYGGAWRDKKSMKTILYNEL